MIYLDDEVIKVGGVILPGLLKNLEVKTDAQIEEQEIEGSSQKPKQATGYEDAKITLDIILDDGLDKTKEEKLQIIQNLFRQTGQKSPTIHEIINQHTALRGISQVILKNLTSKETNKKSEITVSLELWEYVPITITATKSTSSSSTASSSNSTTSNLNLTENYKNYLSNDKGKAPSVGNKTTSSPAADTATGAEVAAALSGVAF